MRVPGEGVGGRRPYPGTARSDDGVQRGPKRTCSRGFGEYIEGLAATVVIKNDPLPNEVVPGSEWEATASLCKIQFRPDRRHSRSGAFGWRCRRVRSR